MTEVFELCGWQISAWSKAGIATCVTARQGRLSLAFDMGELASFAVNSPFFSPQCSMPYYQRHALT
jgi:hypothetical protein